MLIFYLLSIYLINVLCYISPNNFKSIVRLIKNDRLDQIQRSKINKILFKSYEKWAISRAKLFKKKHYYKCSKINLDELSLYSKFGLYTAIKNYNGNSDFNYFANLYVNFELNKALTDAYSSSILPKKIRKQSKKNMTAEGLYNYNNLLFTDYYSDIRHLYQKNQHLPKDLIEDYHNYDKINLIWIFIENNLSPFEKRMMKLKYNYFFNEEKNNIVIAELMCCSRETVRKTLILIKEKIYNEFF